MFLVSSCSCLCPIHWSQVLSREWTCSWSSTDNCIWVIKNFIASYSAPYIRGLMVVPWQLMHWLLMSKYCQIIPSELAKYHHHGCWYKWLLASSGRQLPWFWMCMNKQSWPLFSIGKDFNCQFKLSVDEWYKMEIYICISSKQCSTSRVKFSSSKISAFPALFIHTGTVSRPGNHTTPTTRPFTYQVAGEIRLTGFWCQSNGPTNIFTWHRGDRSYRIGGVTIKLYVSQMVGSLSVTVMFPVTLFWQTESA